MNTTEIFNLIMNYNKFINIRLSEDQLKFFFFNASDEQLQEAEKVIAFRKVFYPILRYEGKAHESGYVVRGKNLNVEYNVYCDTKAEAEETQKENFSFLKRNKQLFI